MNFHISTSKRVSSAFTFNVFFSDLGLYDFYSHQYSKCWSLRDTFSDCGYSIYGPFCKERFHALRWWRTLSRVGDPQIKSIISLLSPQGDIRFKRTLNWANTKALFTSHFIGFCCLYMCVCTWKLWTYEMVPLRPQHWEKTAEPPLGFMNKLCLSEWQWGRMLYCSNPFTLASVQIVMWPSFYCFLSVILPSFLPFGVT